MEPVLSQSISGWNGEASIPSRSSTMIPHFAFTECFEGGAVYSGISAGRGKFVAVGEIAPAPCVVFTVVKDRLKRAIALNVKSSSLSCSIANALGTYLGPGSSHPPDLRTLLENYEPLKQHLEFLLLHPRGNFDTEEFRLLVEDFLLDRAVYEGLGLEQHDRPYVLSQAQLRDLHERSLDTGLDALDDCFRLGTIPFDMGDDDLNALTKRYSQIALSGDLATPNGISGPKMRPRNLVGHPHDPVFSGGAEPEPPGSYQSFSNLAHRIKGPQAGGPFPNTFDALPNPSSSADSVARSFKAGSPFRPHQPHERYASDDSAVGLSSGGFTSLSALENMNTPIGFGDAAPPPRPRASSFHNGIGPIDSALAIPLNLGSGGISSRFEGRPEKDMDLLNWETESEAVFFEARQNSPFPPTSLPVSTFHNAPSGSQNHGPEMPTKEKQSPHLLRQRLGRNLIASLTRLCKTVCDAIGMPEAGSPESLLSSHFASFIHVWDGGVRVFRKIVDNHPPRCLVEVLDCLVVASAMCTAIATYKDHDAGAMYFEFINDMGRWRSVLDPAEHPLFDRVALALWLSVSFGDPMPERADKENLAKFHELIQDLVTLGKEHPRAPARSVPYATQLSAIQREYASREDERSREQATSAPVSIPIPGGGGRKRVFDESLDEEPDLEDDFSISDVFDVDLFLAQSVGDDSEAKIIDLGWNDILSTTVLLLASTAFSAFFTLATIIHRDFDSGPILAVWRRPKGYSRSCDILGHFIESVGGRQGGFRGVPLYRGHSLDQGIKCLSLSTMSAPSTGHMWPPSAWANQAPGCLRMRARASVAPSALHAPAMDLSHSLGAVPHPKRLRCLSASCQKTFSSVSNRNKHMREGCQHREKSGYRCRNGHCPKVLTTKWYRNTHEAERCRYRGAVGEKG